MSFPPSRSKNFTSLCTGWLLLMVMSLRTLAQDGTTNPASLLRALELAPGRVLAMEKISEDDTINPLWILDNGSTPRKVGEIEGEQIQMAVGAEVVVFVADGKLMSTSRRDPKSPEPLTVEGNWLSVVYGSAGFVAGGWEDSFAVSKDGKSWQVRKLRGPGEVGSLAVMTESGGRIAALRQTSENRDGWGVNVSEVCVLSDDGRTWRRLAGLEGGPNSTPLDSLHWGAGQWVALGTNTIFTVTPDGKSERVEFEFSGGNYWGIAGTEPIFRTADGWLMVHGDHAFISTDLKQWKAGGKLTATALKGVWISDAQGAPLFVGSHKSDWQKRQVQALDAVVAMVAAADEVERAAAVAKAEKAAQDAKLTAAKKAQTKAAAAPKVATAKPSPIPAAKTSDKPAPPKAVASKPSEPKTALEFFNRGVERNKKYDREGALGDFIMAAELGEPAGALNAALLFEGGRGIVEGKSIGPDLMQALFWRNEAALMGLKQAQYREPQQSPAPPGLDAAWKAWHQREFVAARKGFEKLAEAGNATALNVLGNFYAEGLGVVLNESKARTFYEKAAQLGSPFAKGRIQKIDAGETVAATMAEHKKMAQMMGEVNATLAGESVIAPKRLAAPTQAEIDRLLKTSPWTYEELVNALDDGANLGALAVALHTAGGNYFELEQMKLLLRPEMKGLDAYESLPAELGDQVKRGGGPWARELAKRAIAERRAQLKSRVVMDSAALRDKAARGDLESLYRLSRMNDAQRTLGPLPQTILQQSLDIKERAIRENYAPALWLNASALQHATDDSKVDLAQAAIYLRASAEVGEAEAALALAKAFHEAPHYKTKEEGVRGNLLAAEYWYIQAGALAEPERKSDEQKAEDALYLLYSFSRPTGGVSFPLYPDELGLRWARELIRRGGAAAEITELKLAKMRSEKKQVDEPLAKLAPEVPAFSAEQLKQMESRCAQGEVSALLTLAEAYATGRGVMQDDAKATVLYRHAAEQGNVSAMRQLAERYEKGYGVKPAKAERIAWLKRAVDAGDRESMMTLAGVLEGQAAIDMYAKAATAGEADGWFRVADIYQYGRGGVEKNEEKFFEFVKRGAEAGSLRAMERLANFYGSTKKDQASAIVWYRRAVEAGHTPSRAVLADLLKRSGDKAGALALYLTLAKEGSVNAQLQTGMLLQDLGREEEGMPWIRKVAATPESDAQKLATTIVQRYDEEKNAAPGTLPYYRKRAREGDNDARVHLALLVNRAWAMDLLEEAASEGHAMATAMYSSELAKDNRAAALEWLKSAAEKGNLQARLLLTLETAATDKAGALAALEKIAQAGNLDAKFRYGSMQYHGQDLPQDRAAGIAKIKEAAEGGFPLAQFNYGKALVGGDVGLPADVATGIAYLKKAAEQTLVRPVAAQAALLLGQIHEQGFPPAAPKSFMKAVAFYREARELSGPNPQLDKHISEVARKASLEMKGMKPSEIK